MKKIFGFIFAGAFFVFALPNVSAVQFSDTSGHKNQTAIQYLYDNDVINGYSDGTFKPNQMVNRAEQLKILIEGKGLNADSYANSTCFSDLQPGAWYVKYVCYAQSKGWVSGYADGTFRPAQTVNRMEALKMLIKSQDINTSLPKTEKNEYLYSDVDITQWYYEYVYAAKHKGFIDNSETIGVNDDMSRSEISEITYRAMIVEKNNLIDFYQYDFNDVTYHETPIELSPVAFLNSQSDYLQLFSVGTINVEPYKNWDLLVYNSCDGMCFNPYIVRLAHNKQTNEFVVLRSHSYDGYASALTGIGYNTSDLIFHSLISPSYVQVAGKYVTLQVEETQS